MINIREENRDDYELVTYVNDQAFKQPEEGRIVEVLRESCRDTISLVAVSDNTLVGHIFFSPVTINHGEKQVFGMGLAPMAVLPDYQNRGIGSLLVKEGLRRIRSTDCPFIIVLGHEQYYPRFGFEPASKYGLKCQWDGVPDNAFMVLVLNKEALAGISGVASYRSEFDEAM